MSLRRSFVAALNTYTAAVPLQYRSTLLLHREKLQCNSRLFFIRTNSTGSWIVQKLRSSPNSQTPVPKTGKQLREEKTLQVFEHYLKEPTEEQFHEIIDSYVKGDKQKRGHVYFINTALQYLEKYNAEKNLVSYKKLLNIFPRDQYNNKSPLDVLWPKPYPQIYCALDILTEMEINGLCPDLETYELVLEIFGHKSDPLEKVTRLKVWFEFSKTLNPHSLPDEVYANKFLLSKSALSRMAGCPVEDVIVIKGDAENQDNFSLCVNGDLQNEIVSAISPSLSLHLDGPIPIWMYKTQYKYFVLKLPSAEVHKALIKNPELDDGNIATKTDDVVLGMLMCDKPNSSTINNWLNMLISKNPKLKGFSIIMSNELGDYLQAQSKSIKDKIDAIDEM